MATLILCDICGRSMRDKTGYKLSSRSRNTQRSIGTTKYELDYDICSECEFELVAWIDNTKTSYQKHPEWLVGGKK